VSTDKATEPVNFMGATKRLMEIALSADTDRLATVFARFANVRLRNVRASCLGGLFNFTTGDFGTVRDIARLYCRSRGGENLFSRCKGLNSADGATPTDAALKPTLNKDVSSGVLRRRGYRCKNAFSRRRRGLILTGTLSKVMRLGQYSDFLVILIARRLRSDFIASEIKFASVRLHR